MPAKPSERQYRILSSPLAPAAGDGDNKRFDTEYYVEGYASTFNDPYVLFEDWDGNEYREIISPDAFKDADMSDVIFNYNHCGRVFARTRNNSLKLNVNKPVGLEMETELWDDDEGHRQLYRDIKRGNIDKMSYCYQPGTLDYTMSEDNDAKKREYHYVLKSIKRVLDVSAVDIPAYNATEISARRFFDAESIDEEAESRNAASVARAKFNYLMKSRRK